VAILSVAALCWSLRAPRSLVRWLTFSAVTLLAALSGHAAFFLLAALFLSAVVTAFRERRTVGVCARALLAILPAAVAAGSWISSRDLPVPLAIFPLPLGRSVLYAITALGTTGPHAPLWGGLLFLCVVLGGISAAKFAARNALVAVVIVGVGGVVVASTFLHLQFDVGQVDFVLPAYLLLAGAGLSVLRHTVAGRFWPRLAWAVPCGALVVVGLIQWPSVRAEVQRSNTNWRDAARMVAANALPGQPIVVLSDRASFVFYAPHLEARVEPAVRPALAPGYFVRVERGWLIAPAAVRLYPGWNYIARWLERFPPVNLSPDPSIDVFYMGRGDRDLLHLEAAFFDLPTAVLVRGNLLFRLLQTIGPIPQVLWKVDQIALSRERLNLRNPDLLNALYFLAEHGHADRAASLAYRLAMAEPDWQEAQRALAAFRPVNAPVGAAAGNL